VPPRVLPPAGARGRRRAVAGLMLREAVSLQSCALPLPSLL
jgi:hypothetical protein